MWRNSSDLPIDFESNRFSKGTIVNISKILLVATSAVLLSPFSIVASAQSDRTADIVLAEASVSDMTLGEVRKVDKDTKKITIKHGEIKNLDMPGMTMLFQVKDPAMLDMVKPGDKVQFKAEKAGGALVVTEIQVAK